MKVMRRTMLENEAMEAASPTMENDLQNIKIEVQELKDKMKEYEKKQKVVDELQSCLQQCIGDRDAMFQKLCDLEVNYAQVLNEIIEDLHYISPILTIFNAERRNSDKKGATVQDPADKEPARFRDPELVGPADTEPDPDTEVARFRDPELVDVEQIKYISAMRENKKLQKCISEAEEKIKLLIMQQEATNKKLEKAEKEKDKLKQETENVKAYSADIARKLEALILVCKEQLAINIELQNVFSRFEM